MLSKKLWETWWADVERQQVAEWREAEDAVCWMRMFKR